MNRFSDFAVLILTYGRADRVTTLKALERGGYTGRTFLVCSTDDSQLSAYQERYPEQVITFSKDDYRGKFDIGDNFRDDRVVVFARNAAWDIAEKLGIEYFLVLDDDYTDFRFKFTGQLIMRDRIIHKNLDLILDAVLRYYKSIPALSIALAQGGDFIGGTESTSGKSIRTKRKIMNTFFCSTKRRFQFIGRINEDTNTYVYLGTIGKLVFQTNQLAINQVQTQANKGGLTEFYLDTGTYIKSFYTVMISPSCTKVYMMGDNYKRLHHKIDWKSATPVILSEQWRKKSEERLKAADGKK